ncbi:hypothetical protein PO909_027758 [Leuciscus waleckii]
MSPSLITAIASIILYSKINKRDSGRNLRLGVTSCAFTARSPGYVWQFRLPPEGA